MDRLDEDERQLTVEIAAAPYGHDWVLELQEPDETKLVPLGMTPLVLGSSRGADLVVDDRTVSGRHCEVCVVGDQVKVLDLGSRNGTFVGGARVREAWAGLGTVITFGESSVIFGALGEDDDRTAHNLPAPLSGLAGGSVAMRRIAAQVRRLANLSAPVLVSGETGTGKELVTRALHAEGRRKAGPFVAVNVAALPRELVESELFGHERGAFTGAVARRLGAFTDARTGTLFLDEIGELPLDAQPKLLRALDGYEVKRVGAGGSGDRSEARVVAATHKPLLEDVSAGRFRRDLFHRLEVFVVALPALRDRPGDIAPIARKLLSGMASEVGERTLSSGALARLVSHEWPGNVRELRNVLLRAADISTHERCIGESAISRAMRRPGAPRSMTLTPTMAEALLRQHAGNLTAAARAAGLPRTTFRKIIFGR